MMSVVQRVTPAAAGPPREVDGPDDGPASDALAAAVGRAQLGDPVAFTEVYRTVHPLLMRYLRGIVGQDAEDVASEAWLQITRDLGTFAGNGDAFRGWAATIARNRARDHLRSAKRRPRSSLAELDDELRHGTGYSPGPESLLMDSQATRAAVDLIASLPKEQAEALLLRVVMDLDVETAARVLGKRPGAVRTATHRGLRALAARVPAPLSTADPDPPPRSPPASVLRRTGESLHIT